MIERIKNHKTTFILCCLLLLIALRSTKEFYLTDRITYLKWTSPEGTGLVMTGWQALGVIFGEAAIGAYGILLILKSKRDT